MKRDPSTSYQIAHLDSKNQHESDLIIKLLLAFVLASISALTIGGGMALFSVPLQDIQQAIYFLFPVMFAVLIMLASFFRV